MAIPKLYYYTDIIRRVHIKSKKMFNISTSKLMFRNFKIDINIVGLELREKRMITGKEKVRMNGKECEKTLKGSFDIMSMSFSCQAW
ncbi:hypothetical protein S225a_14120 [Candidatus Brocadiaceae bacterium S225]|uniref:Uncharacterized protein n=1 Tax=Candidatus Scalindua brodae TaxID=237368 RepID=A0A0B0ECJ4_9BACT|nr:MAG: hypothetical protein SCABRO_03243 [Candidatus Scalindua brodae]TWU33523.1 hypothetical protein S225a_14120 [Candidatus Brocadiaceae bacterium S225]